MMHILMPMNGTGERFKAAGYTVPKPFLPINGDPLIAHVLRCYDGLGQITLLPRREYINDTLWSLMKQHSCELVVMDENTTGPLTTILTPQHVVHPHEELLIADSDSVIDKNELIEALTIFREIHCAGGVLTRVTNDPSCSFAKVTSEGWVTETREKDPFTNVSTTGPYLFASGTVFLHAAHEAIRDGVRSIAPVYNYVIQQGGKVKAVPTFSFIHLGIPQTYESYAAKYTDRLFQKN